MRYIIKLHIWIEQVVLMHLYHQVRIEVMDLKENKGKIHRKGLKKRKGKTENNVIKKLKNIY